MRKIFWLLALIIIFIILVVANIIIYNNDFRKIDKEFIALHKDVNAVKYWAVYRDVSYVKRLEQKIQDEAATRVLHNWEQDKKYELIVEEFERASQRELLILKNEIERLKFNQDTFINSIQNTIGSVVHIANLSQDWQGSGVAWTEDIIVTARHIVESGTDFLITLNDGTEINATEAISSEKYDIGFIKLNEKVLIPAKFASVKETVLGQQIYVIGSPYGKLNFNSVTLGIVSGLNRNQESIDWSGKLYGWSVAFTTDSAGHPGNSGCPVFTLDGKVRGILVGGYSPVLIICIPVDLFVDKLSTIEMMFEQRMFYDEKPLYDYNQNYNSNKDWTPFEIE